LASAATDQDIWTLRLAGGYEVFTNAFSLAENDTTETIAEATFTTSVMGRSGRGSRHRWLLSAESSLGTELIRERIDGDFRWCDESGAPRLRFSCSGRARQYRQETVYGLSSDSGEGRMDLRGYPVAGGDYSLETRAWTSGLYYQVPSTLELDQREKGGSLVMRHGQPTGANWSMGAHFARRTYPDSTGLDRNTTGCEGSWEGSRLRIYQRSDRRAVKDEETRSPAWNHWTDLDLELPFSSGAVFLELQDEIWKYDLVQGAFPDYLRTSARLGYDWGDLLAVRWRVGLSGEIMRSDDDSESYDQYGVLAGVESYGLDMSGSLLVESGWRRYRGQDGEFDAADGTWSDYSGTGFTDFNYWKIWLTGGWNLTPRLALDLLASYEPERHGEKSDDTTLGFASVRLVWRP